MDEPEVTSEDFKGSIKQLMDAAPAPIQSFLLSDERDRIIRKIAVARKLHVDQADVFSQSLIFMLLGAYMPDEFIQALEGAGIDTVTTRAIVQDVNQEVFIPIQNKEKTEVPVAPSTFSDETMPPTQLNQPEMPALQAATPEPVIQNKVVQQFPPIQPMQTPSRPHTGDPYLEPFE